MLHISLLLGRFKEIENVLMGDENMMLRIIQEETGIILKRDKIKITQTGIKIDCSPIERSRLLESREQIELKVNEFLKRVGAKMN